MNYRNIYIQILAKAKREVQQGIRPKNYNQKKNFPNQYFEFHHILPSSLFPLWIKRKSNIVPLTAREHFFCHELLTKIFPGRSMNYALIKLTYSRFHHPSAKQYERAKLLNFQNALGESNPNYGHKWSEAQKKQLLKEQNYKTSFKETEIRGTFGASPKRKLNRKNQKVEDFLRMD